MADGDDDTSGGEQNLGTGAPPPEAFAEIPGGSGTAPGGATPAPDTNSAPDVQTADLTPPLSSNLEVQNEPPQPTPAASPNPTLDTDTPNVPVTNVAWVDQSTDKTIDNFIGTSAPGGTTTVGANGQGAEIVASTNLNNMESGQEAGLLVALGSAQQAGYENKAPVSGIPGQVPEVGSPTIDMG